MNLGCRFSSSYLLVAIYLLTDSRETPPQRVPPSKELRILVLRLIEVVSDPIDVSKDAQWIVSVLQALGDFRPQTHFVLDSTQSFK